MRESKVGRRGKVWREVGKKKTVNEETKTRKWKGRVKQEGKTYIKERENIIQETKTKQRWENKKERKKENKTKWKEKRMELRLIFVVRTDILYRNVRNQIPNYPRNVRDEQRPQLYRSGRLQACATTEYFRLRVNYEYKAQIYNCHVTFWQLQTFHAIKLPCSRARQPKENQIPTSGIKTGRRDNGYARTPNATCPRRQWSFGVRLQRDIRRCWFQPWGSLSYDAVSPDRCRRSQGQKPGCEPQKSP
jgi:hypothetical protein